MSLINGGSGCGRVFDKIGVLIFEGVVARFLRSEKEGLSRKKKVISEKK